MSRTRRLTDPFVDTIEAALRAIVRRPARTAGLISGTVIGSLILTLSSGLATTSQTRIKSVFDELRPTSIAIQYQDDEGGTFAGADTRLPGAGMDRLRSLRSVIDVSRYSVAPQQIVASRGQFDADDLTDLHADVIGIDASFWDATEATLDGDPPPTIGRALPGVVLSEAMMRRLRISDYANARVVVAGRQHVVTGTIRNAKTFPQSYLAVLVGEEFFDESFVGHNNIESGAIVKVVSGSAEMVADRAAVTLRPDKPEILRISTAAEPTRLRSTIESDVSLVTRSTALLGFAIAAVMVANIMFLATVQRRAEFAVQRALGASGGRIGLQILLEAVVTGSVGGLVGTAISLLGVLGWAAVRGWTPAMTDSSIIIGIGMGPTAATIGAVVPAILASRVPPALALKA